ncbi:MAG: DNA primase, partial [Chloroflexota bacterium]
MGLDIKALKLRVDLVAVIQAAGVPLKAQGANFVTPCVFHREKTASFTVNPAKRIWKCLGCNVGGDVFKFFKLKENLTLGQAIQRIQALAPELATTHATPAPAPTGDEQPMEPITQPVLDRVTAHWQKALATASKAQAYLRARHLWRPELLRALKIGYASGSLARALPGGGTLRRQLTQLGILNKSSNEFFYGRIVVPIYSDGLLVGVYGRAISGLSKVPHLYLKGPHRGVFNATGIRDAADVILAEAPLDALSVMALGFPNVTSSYGANGFTPEIRAVLVRSKTARVYCIYDPDPAGDQAADQLAHDLAGHGIEVRRVVLPAAFKDPNDFLCGGGTREQFQELLDGARPMIAPRPAVLAPAPAVAAAATPAAVVPTPPTTPAPRESGVLSLVRGPRTYEVLPIPGADSLALRVRLKARHEGKSFVDTLNLYSDRARLAAAVRLARVFGAATRRETIEADLLSLIEDVEAHAKTAATATEPTPADTLTDQERATALAFLAALDLVTRIREDLTAQGVTGEDRSKLLVYLVATSRKLPKPLSLCVVSRSSGGKSFIVSKVCELMPPEEYFGYTRMSSKALFHDDTDRLRHKLLSIEEAEGMEEAAYALRVMQSNQMLRNLSTITDPTTGKHKASENIVHGPVALIVTTTQELDFETVSRAFVISVDESSEQTERIHEMQRQARTLEGLGTRLDRLAIVAKHQNAQRLLRPLVVVNPFAPRLTFPSG